MRGTFQLFSGTIEEEDGKVAAASVDFDVNSTTTGAAQRDEHLEGADFLDTAAYPRASFQLTKFDRIGNDVMASGDLTMRGATHPITINGDIDGPAKNPYGNQKCPPRSRRPSRGKNGDWCKTSRSCRRLTRKRRCSDEHRPTGRAGRVSNAPLRSARGQFTYTTSPSPSMPSSC